MADEAFFQEFEEEGLSLIEAHTHPWAHRVRFLEIDRRSHARKFQATERLFPPFRHASLVFGGDGSFQGVLWDPLRRVERPVDRIKILGPTLEVRYGTDRPPEPLEAAQRAIYDRQIRAFGEAGQQALGACTVGLVGAGGLGSIIAQALALLGVGRLVLVDPDRLEPSNANRVVMVTPADVRRRRAKVKALAERLRRSGLHPPAVLAIPASAVAPEAWEALLGVDVLIGAVDSARVRMFLNLLSVAALIPYIDGGVGIRVEGGRLRAGGGQVRVVVPGAGPCLMCTDAEAGERALEALDPERRAEAIARGYIQGEAVPRPQVIFLNGIVGHLLVWEFVKLVTGCLPVRPYVYYDLVGGCAFEPEGAVRRPDCLACSPAGWLARGRGILEAFPPAQAPSPFPAREGIRHGGDPYQPPRGGPEESPASPPHP